MNQAAKENEVCRGSIQKWVKKYGNLDKKLRNMGDERMITCEKNDLMSFFNERT